MMDGAGLSIPAPSKGPRIGEIREIRNTALWAKQITYWRTHLDAFIVDYQGIALKDTQRVIARAFGKCELLYIVKSRGYGKTWLTAVCCLAMGIQYPGSFIAVASRTADQATLVLRKIKDELLENPNILREIKIEGSHGVRIATNKGVCVLKNGSKIESYSIQTMRGQRAKILVIDEAPEVREEDLNAILKPVRNATRSRCVQYGLTDYPSKMVSITSACLKSNYYYDTFKGICRDMANGNDKVFCCALDYFSASRIGVTRLEYFESERGKMEESRFKMEYGSIFIGEEDGSYFPYSLVETCRTLKHVETAIPKGSKCEYVIGVDLATSGEKRADNAVLCVLKLFDRPDGGITKRLVYMRSYKGKQLVTLAEEVRRLWVKFPTTCKVVFDHRGLGDAFPAFFSEPWTDPETGMEYPPWILDTEVSLSHNYVKMLRSVKADATSNQQMASALRIALEQKTIELPINSKYIFNGKLVEDDPEEADAESEDIEPVGVKDKRKPKGTNVEIGFFERNIYVEADALQVEMGNIVAKMSPGGRYLYDTARSSQHKDRYSSLAMALWYVAELELEQRKRMRGGF